MKKIVLFVVLFFATISLPAQEYDTIRLSDGNVTITPELAKELLLYSYITMTDSFFIGESMNYQTCHYCDGWGGMMFLKYYELDRLRFQDQMEDWGILITDGIENIDDFYIDESSKYSSVSDYINGYAVVRDGLNEGYYNKSLIRETDGRHYALIDKQGKVCIPFGKYDKIKGGVFDNMIPVCKQGKWGFADPSGNVIIKIQYSDVRHFSEGLAAVKKDGKWGYIDTKGAEKIPFKYVDAYPFKKGVAVVRREGTIGEYCDASTIPGGLAVGLVDHEGHSTYDYYDRDATKEMPIQEYAGIYVDDITRGKGYAKYTYYENGNGRVKHGYYVFVNESYIIEGHYKDGEKHGGWLKMKRNQNVLDWSTLQDFINKYNPITKKKDPSLPGYYYGNQIFIIGKDTVNPNYIDWPFRHNRLGSHNIIYYVNGVPYGDFEYIDGIELYSHCSKGIVDRDVNISGIYYSYCGFMGEGPEMILPMDKNGDISGSFSFFQGGGDNGDIPMEITLTFYKGVPVSVVEDNKSTGEKKTLFEYEGFTSVDDIVDVVASNGIYLCKIGEYYYFIEPKDPYYPFDFMDIDKYSGCISKPLSFLLNLPKSWPVPDVKSPQLNVLKRATWDNLKSVYYEQYGKLFETKYEYDMAYSRGEQSFMLIVEEKQKEVKQNTFNQYQHLFCDRNEFDTNYNKGEVAFSKVIAFRDGLYANYLLNKEWFANFWDYYTIVSARKQPEKEINERQKVYAENKAYYINSVDFATYYAKGVDSVLSETERRRAAYEKCIDPFTGFHLFKDMDEFLMFYSQGTIIQEVLSRKRANKDEVYKQYGNVYVNKSDFDLAYGNGRQLFMKETAIRLFNSRIGEFSGLKLKEAITSKKDDVKQYLAFVNECTEMSQDAYPEIVKMMVTTNEKMAKEWASNGQYFDSEVGFYEAYISDSYKEILKGRKK